MRGPVRVARLMHLAYSAPQHINARAGRTVYRALPWLSIQETVGLMAAGSLALFNVLCTGCKL